MSAASASSANSFLAGPATASVTGTVYDDQDGTGSVTVYTGTHSHGQGHETTFAQVVADKLGIPLDQLDAALATLADELGA